MLGTLTQQFNQPSEHQDSDHREVEADHTWGPWRFLTRLHCYDSFFGDHFLVDAELSYTFLKLPFMRAA